jgi:hypothetical protein
LQAAKADVSSLQTVVKLQDEALQSSEGQFAFIILSKDATSHVCLSDIQIQDQLLFSKDMVNIFLV